LNRAVPGVLVDTLVRVPLFSDLDERELRLLADSMRERTFPAGVIVIAEGTAADSFFVINDGDADVTVLGERRGTMVPGDYFGEIALLLGTERTATVTARSDLQCYVLSARDFRSIVEGNPPIAWKVMQSMAARLA
jgi:CRP-like cAMP-binding protein